MGARASGLVVTEREKRAKGKERQARHFLRLRVTDVARASGHALLSRRPDASISRKQSKKNSG